jgi:2,3-bisphosphoglycerate-independent phosphoglycerate mutase
MLPPLVLVVLDGWGLRREHHHNAIAVAQTPNYDELLERFPFTTLEASGESVGLPADQMGNSEVGHLNLGAGRVVYQNISRIDASIHDGSFSKNHEISLAIDRCHDRHALHLVGLLSDGGVHSHQRHLHALLRIAAERKVTRVFVHVFMDGRDSAPTAGIDYLATLERTMKELGVGQVATVCGRYYAMDRDRRWERTQRAYDALVLGTGLEATSAPDAITAAYSQNVTDEFIEPTVIVNSERQAVGRLAASDSVIIFNFRADRARQLTRALAFEKFDGFTRRDHPSLNVTTMTQYDATFKLPVAFVPQAFSGNLAEVLAANQVTNLRLAETEKYAHVTYFFNSGEEQPYIGEDRILVPSPKVPTYDKQPEMSAALITDQLVQDLDTQKHRVIVCNFANADMVGHTGDLTATVSAVETLDRCLGRIAKSVMAVNGTLFVTSDHGNAEQLWDRERKCPHTAHTTHPVPLVMVKKDLSKEEGQLRRGSLRDVAPTMLSILGIQPAPAMTGSDLRGS